LCTAIKVGGYYKQDAEKPLNKQDEYIDGIKRIGRVDDIYKDSMSENTENRGGKQPGWARNHPIRMSVLLSPLFVINQFTKNHNHLPQKQLTGPINQTYLKGGSSWLTKITNNQTEP
jgi:hypothetical protein